MGEIPKSKGMEEAEKTRKAVEKLPEKGRVIHSSDVGQLRAMIAEKKIAPETVTAAADKYYQEHPELIKPLERLEKLMKEG